MIRFLEHDAIDRTRWNELLAACSNRLWYARSHVLDAASPGWCALVDEADGAIMPLTWRRKWGIDYLHNPYGLQQLGLFTPGGGSPRTAEFLAAIPARFRYVDIWLNADMPEVSGVPGRWIPQVNQSMVAPADIATARAAYAKGHKRNLNKAEVPIINTNALSAEAFLDLFERTTGERFGGSPPGSIPVLTRVIEVALQEGLASISSIAHGGHCVAAACFITWNERSILMKAANTDAGMEQQAMFHLVDHWIARHAGSGITLDFAGSNTPSVARFNSGFGAAPSTYFRYRLNRLPWPLRLLKP